MRRHLIPLVLAIALVIGVPALAKADLLKPVPNGYCWEKTFEGYYDGNTVIRFILTDVSNPQWAKWMLINYAPILGLIDPDSDGVGDVYFFNNFNQYPVFSTQREEDDYTPIWDVELVTWLDPNEAIPLLSAEEVSDAAGDGLVEVVETGIILDAPHVENIEGEIIPQSMWGNWIGEPYKSYGGAKYIRLPVFNGYVKNKQVTFLKTDFENEYLAGEDQYDGNYAPDMGDLLEDYPYVFDVRYAWAIDLDADPKRGVCPVNQWSVYGEAPSPIGWGNRNYWYSPLREHFTIQRADGRDYSNVYRNADLIELLLGNGVLEFYNDDGDDGAVNSPTLKIPFGNTLKATR